MSKLGEKLSIQPHFHWYPPHRQRSFLCEENRLSTFPGIVYEQFHARSLQGRLHDPQRSVATSTAAYPMPVNTLSMEGFHRIESAVQIRCQFPLNTWRNNNVVITSKRRHFDVITSKWRRFGVITTSLLRNVSAGLWRHLTYTLQVSREAHSFHLLTGNGTLRMRYHAHTMTCIDSLWFHQYSFNMLNCFEDYKRYIHILNHILDLVGPK